MSPFVYFLCLIAAAFPASFATLAFMQGHVIAGVLELGCLLFWIVVALYLFIKEN